MKSKWVFFAAFGVFLALLVYPCSGAVNTRQIEIVRNKGVLNSQDMQIIDAFVGEAVRELVRTKDFTSIAHARSAILSRRLSKKSSAQAQYGEQFSVSAHKYISEGFEQAKQYEEQDRKFKTILNLLILIDGLEDVRLAGITLGLLRHPNMVIRYWAIHSVTNPGFTKQLNAKISSNSQLARTIVERLQGLVNQSGPEVVVLAAEFAATVDTPEGEDLLVRIADNRIKKYADWKVNYELLDAAVLKQLSNKISAGAMDRAALAQRFGQLYSHVINRYVKGRDVLNAAQKHQLASVMIETEVSCISKILGTKQTVIKRSIERDDYTRLVLEKSRLLGDPTRAGIVPMRLNYDYGRKPDGSARTAPIPLQDPPRK